MRYRLFISCFIVLAVAITVPVPVCAGIHIHWFSRRDRTKLPPVPPAPGALGYISGTVSGGLQQQQGARLVLTQNEKEVDETTSDAAGNFRFNLVYPGTYEIKCTKQGFRSGIVFGIPVYADQTTTNNFYIPQYNSPHMRAYPAVLSYTDNLRR